MKNRLTALVVDDMKGARKEISNFLLQYIPDLRILEAEDGIDGYALIQRYIGHIDMVFTDINMPQVSGLKLIKILREVESFKNLPIIVISILNAREEIDKALWLGANGYLTKPVKKEDFEIIYAAIIEPMLRDKHAP